MHLLFDSYVSEGVEEWQFARISALSGKSVVSKSEVDTAHAEIEEELSLVAEMRRRRQEIMSDPSAKAADRLRTQLAEKHAQGPRYPTLPPPKRDLMSPDPQETSKLLVEAKRRGYRLPGEPTQWEDVTPEEVIRRLQDAEANPQNQISITVPAGCSVDEITAIVSRTLHARRG